MLDCQYIKHIFYGVTEASKIRMLKAAEVFNRPRATLEIQTCPGGGEGSICVMELTLKKGIFCYTSPMRR